MKRILHRLHGREFNIVQLAFHLLDLTHVFVLNNVPGLRINSDWAAGAFPTHALHRRNKGIPTGVAPSLLQSLMQEVHSVVASDRMKRRADAISLSECVDVSLIDRRIVKHRVVMRGDKPNHASRCVCDRGAIVQRIPRDIHESARAGSIEI